MTPVPPPNGVDSELSVGIGARGVGVGDTAGVSDAVGVELGVNVCVGVWVGVADDCGMAVLVSEGATRVGVRLGVIWFLGVAVI